MDRRPLTKLLLICLAVATLGAGGLLAFSVLSGGAALAQDGFPFLDPRTYLPLVARSPFQCETASLLKGPEIVLTGDNTEMKLVWQLDSSRLSIVQWGLDPRYALGTAVTAETGPDHMYSYTIGGLIPGARYDYRVIASPACYEGTFYAALPDTATALKFFAYGDTRNGIAVNDTIASQIMRAYAADPGFQTFNLAVGDLVSGGDLESAWGDEFFDPHYLHLRTVLSNLAFLPVMGNHEGSGALFMRYFPMPFVAGRYWSFDYGPAHIVMLDQYRPYAVGSAQYAWLKEDLAASSKKWKFLVLHEPGWSAGGGHTNNARVQNDIQPLAEQYGVSIIFGGHNHYYARAVVNGIQHLTVGGGGAPLYSPNPGAAHVVAARSAYSFAEIVISGDVLTGTAVAADGADIETFTITR